MNGIVGKTVARVEVRPMMAEDTFGDTVWLDETVVTFTDGSSTSFLGPTCDLYDLRPSEEDNE